MSSDKIEDATVVAIDFAIVPGERGSFDADSLHRIVQACYAAIEKEGYSGYGSEDEDEEEEHLSSLNLCKVCEGTGLNVPQPGTSECPTCEGYGAVEVDEESLRLEWDDLYSEEEEEEISVHEDGTLNFSPLSAEEILDAVGVTPEQRERARRTVESTRNGEDAKSRSKGSKKA